MAYIAAPAFLLWLQLASLRKTLVSVREAKARLYCFGKLQPASGTDECACMIMKISPFILQGIVLFDVQVRCPAYIRNSQQEMTTQGKGTADHVLPLGDWFMISTCVSCE